MYKLYKLTLLAIEAAEPVIVLLCVDVESFVLDVVVPLLEFPVDILRLENLPDACLEDQGVVDPRNLLRFQNVLEFHAPVGKMADHRKGVFLLHPFLPGTLVHDGHPPGFCWFV